jgi:hypothetical protein
VVEFCPITQSEGHQALFRLPKDVDRERIERELVGFFW